MSEPLRRSTRTVIPTSPFTIDNSPLSQKRKWPGNRKIEVEKVEILQKSPKIPENPEKTIVSTNPRRRIEQVHRYDPKSAENLKKIKEENIGLKNDMEMLNRQGKSMTVKQLLAKNFKNYRVRPSITSERATELVKNTIKENDVPQGALLRGPPVIPANVKIGSFFQDPKEFKLEDMEIGKEILLDFQFPHENEKNIQEALNGIVENRQENPIQKEPKEEPEDFPLPLNLNYRLDELNPLQYPGNHLPWPLMWKLIPQNPSEDILLSIDSTIYTPMSDVIKSGRFLVPMYIPVEFKYKKDGKNGKEEVQTVTATFDEVLTANGVNLTPSQHYRMLQGLFQRAQVFIRADYAERLHKIQAIMENGGNYQMKEDSPIEITSKTPPLVCQNPDVYISSLGRRLHAVALIDTSGDQTGRQSYSSTIYSESLPFEARRQILLLHSASDIPIDKIANRFNCSIQSIHETIKTRLLIERRLIQEHLQEEEGVEDVTSSEFITDTIGGKTNFSTIGDVMRPRNKIRRTHYVDLNKLVWKHFQECQSQGLQINGKHLKDQAMRYAREMGLDTFRGSEGWLDAFKRRHRIDLKQMTGHPVCYENDMYDEVDKECQDMSPTLLDHPNHSHLHQNHHHHQFLHPGPEDFALNFFNSLSTFQQPEPTTSTHLQNMINSIITPPTTSSGSSTSSGNGEHAQNTPESAVIRSCTIKVADKEVSHALDTLRAYILKNDPAAMSLLLPLQERLSSAAGTGFEIDTIAPSSSS